MYIARLKQNYSSKIAILKIPGNAFEFRNVWDSIPGNLFSMTPTQPYVYLSYTGTCAAVPYVPARRGAAMARLCGQAIARPGGRPELEDVQLNSSKLPSSSASCLQFLDLHDDHDRYV